MEGGAANLVTESRLQDNSGWRPAMATPGRQRACENHHVRDLPPWPGQSDAQLQGVYGDVVVVNTLGNPSLNIGDFFHFLKVCHTIAIYSRVCPQYNACASQLGVLR
jgi:hypothetical protein